MKNHQNYENAKFALCELLHSFKIYLDLYPKTFVILKQNLYTFMTGYITTQNHFLYELMNQISQELVTGGILQHAIEMSYSEDFMKYKFYSNFYLIDNATILTFSDFAYGFTLWIFACIICYVVFLLELTTFYLKLNPVYHLKNFVGLYFLICGTFAYYRN